MTSGDATSIAERVGDVLRDRSETVATAEACTAGLVSARLASVPGASDYLDGGVISYSYDSRRTRLGVSREALDAHGAVSEPVAREMAARIRDRADVTWGVSTTGVAGPAASGDIPPGTVWIGIAYAAPWETEASFATASRHAFDGGRNAVRDAAADRALERLAEQLEDIDRPPSD